jgi:hypothetical protein
MDADPRLGSFHAQAHGDVFVGLMRHADSPDRIPPLDPCFGFAGLEVGKIRLVVGIDPRHQLDVGAADAMLIRVGEQAIPGVTELVVSPGPLLLARRDVRFGHVDDSRADAVVVTAKKCFARAHTHVGSRHWDIRIPREIVGWIRSVGPELRRQVVRRHPFPRPPCVVHAVVMPQAKRKQAHRPLGVIRHKGRVLREKRLILLMHFGGDIGPPEKGLNIVGPIIDTRQKLEHGMSRT